MILLFVGGGAHLEVLVAGGGAYLHRGGVGGNRQGVRVRIRAEGGLQRTGIEGQCLDGLVVVVPAAAQILAGAGIHHTDLVAVGYGEAAEAHADEPVVQRAHPAGTGAAVKLAKLLGALGDLGDVVGVGADGGEAVLLQRRNDAGHHGGAAGDGDVLIHQRARPWRGNGLFTIVIRRGEGGVLHNNVDLARRCVCCSALCCEHSGGYQAQYHHQCHQQRDYAFSHV